LGGRYKKKPEMVKTNLKKKKINCEAKNKNK
jgi:hypothetical protein